MLTKGDINRISDRGLYPPGEMWLHQEDINGIVQARLPYIGVLILLFNVRIVVLCCMVYLFVKL